MKRFFINLVLCLGIIVILTAVSHGVMYLIGSETELYMSMGFGTIVGIIIFNAIEIKRKKGSDKK